MFLDSDHVWAFQAADRLTYVHHPDGTFCVDLSLNALEAILDHQGLRVHRNWLVLTAHVRAWAQSDGDSMLTVGVDLQVPVARDRTKEVRQRLLGNTIGLRFSQK